MSETNQVIFEHIPHIPNSHPSFNPSPYSSEFSVRFFISPPPSEWHPGTYEFGSQPIPQVEPNPQLDVPLLHPDTGLPITLDLQTESTSPPATSSQDSETHTQVTPLPQSASAQNHPQSPPNVSQPPLPERLLHLLPQAENGLDQEPLEECLQRLQSASKGETPEAPQHVETEKGIRADTVCEDISVPEHVPILNRTPTPEVKNGEGGSVEAEITQECSGDTVGVRNPTHENNTRVESPQEEPAHEHAEDVVDGPDRPAVQVQEEELPERQNETTQSPRGLDDETHSNDIIPTHGQPNESPVDNIEVEPQRRRRGRKRRRREVETGYWLRSRKPPSSSKRSRRTTYWLRP